MMTPATLRAWRLALGYTQAEAATALGLSTRVVGYYEAGERNIPGPVALACAAISAGLQPLS